MTDTTNVENGAAVTDVTSTAADPSEAINAQIAAAGVTDPIVYNVESKYHFRKDPKAEAAGLVAKRPTVSLMLPMPTVNGVIQALKDDKQRDLVLEAVANLVFEAARSQVNDETKPVNSQDELDASKLTLAFIANQPKAERRGGGIPKDTWEAFEADYISVMPAVASKTTEQVTRAAKILVAKLQPVKTNKPVIKLLKDQLDLWFTNTPNAEEFAEIYEFLTGKAETFANLTDEDLTANL